MKTALITGISGQDGSYLSELLIKKNYRVIGTTRNKKKIKNNLSKAVLKKIIIVEWDLVSLKQLNKILCDYSPDEIYNFASYSSGQTMYEKPEAMMIINGDVVVNILDAIKRNNILTKFCQASSSEMFGVVSEVPQSEVTKFNPQNPYAKAKLYAHNKISYYRDNHGLFACSAILYNHESPRRGTNFVTRKITSQAAKIKLNLQNKLELGDISSRRDWMHSKDAVKALYLMMQSKNPADYVVASGEDHSVEEFCQAAFSYLDLNYKDYVIQSKSHFRNHDSVSLIGNPTKIRGLGWDTQYNFDEIVKEMVDSDLKKLTI